MDKKPGSTRVKLTDFTGRHKPLIAISCVLSVISAVVQLSPFVCIYFAVREVLTAVSLGVSPDVSKLSLFGWLAVVLSAAALCRRMRRLS